MPVCPQLALASSKKGEIIIQELCCNNQ
jgi:hypothetical protein